VSFARHEPVPAREYVAEQIRRQISLHLVQAGHALPAERRLAAMFHVARSTVQQAIGILEEDGLVERRRGRRGGTFVRDTLGDAMDMEALVQKIRNERHVIEEALAYRRAIEPSCVARAARQRTPDDLRRVEEAARRATGAETDTAFMGHDTEFHLAIARASHNRFFVAGIEEIRVLLAPLLAVLPDSRLWHQRTHLEHGSIVAAIAGGDETRARNAALRHVSHTEESAEAFLAVL
jgi:GntR family transcriptional repressor for pyruvate dehydrogenase complex